MIITTKTRIIAMALTDKMYCAFIAILFLDLNDSSHPIPVANIT